MYPPHKHGVLDHAFLSVFLRVEGKFRKSRGPNTDPCGTDHRISCDAENGKYEHVIKCLDYCSVISKFIKN